MRHCLYFFIVCWLFVHGNGVAQTPSITRGPYLQVLSPTSVTVRWRTNQPTTGRVWYGLASPLANAVGESQPSLEHNVTLTGLQAATQYLYAVGFDNTQLASGPDYYVKTALPTGDTRPFRMWVLGDFGCGLSNQTAVYQAYKQATANRPSDLWLWLGDNAYSFGLEDEYQQWVFPFYAASLRNIPLFITPGNHDYADQETNTNIAYYNLFSFPQQGESGGVSSGSKSYYSANYGNVHLVSLDSQGRPDGQFRLYDTTSVQVQWLKRDLAANTLPWTVVIFHHPPYSKGGHNSDTEESMRLIRENLTPILERYGVDLVLNGHSHIYERTYRIKGMRGLANTFNANVNIAENTSARYDGSPNSCPILTKGQGTVYIVAGSGGQLNSAVSPGFPHPATVYNNTTIGGSLLLDVNDNRLDVQWVASDGTVPDRFTLLKNVNKIATLTAEYADTLQLSASWPGDYRWSGGQTSRTIQYVASTAGNFQVTASDDNQCLQDQFSIAVQQPPKITTRLTAASGICAGSSVTITAVPENTTKAAGWQYDVLLSDAAGDFTNSQVIGSGTLLSLNAVVPASVTPGANYKIQVRPRGIAYAQLVPTDGFAVKGLPTATLAGSVTLTPGASASLTLTFTGDGPWQGMLSDGTSFSSTISPLTLAVQPAKSTVYSVASVSNSCGQGSSLGQAAVTVLLPTGTETLSDARLRVYPNPAHDVLYIELNAQTQKPVSLSLMDTQGRQVFQKQLGIIATLNEAILMPQAPGTYLLTVQYGDNTLTRKIVRQ